MSQLFVYFFFTDKIVSRGHVTNFFFEKGASVRATSSTLGLALSNIAVQSVGVNLPIFSAMCNWSTRPCNGSPTCYKKFPRKILMSGSEMEKSCAKSLMLSSSTLCPLTLLIAGMLRYVWGLSLITLHKNNPLYNNWHLTSFL